jgi:hypothetical protein
MKSLAIVMAALAVCLASSSPGIARVDVWHRGVVAADIDLRSQDVVILAEQTISVDGPGRVLVQFDGHCIAEPGDIIALAAADDAHRGAGEACTSVMVYDDDIDTAPFSHSRVFDVAPGSHTFYALGQNIQQFDGSGVASVCGSLTVTYYPDWDRGARVWHRGVNASEIDLRGPDHVLAQQTIGIPVAGRALVRFDGFATSSAGDRIDTWVGRTLDLPGGDDMTAFEAPDADHELSNYSHARVYALEAGLHDFYVGASNLVETGGDGHASFFGNLTVQFFAAGSQAIVRNTGVVRVFVSVRGAPVTLGQVTLDAAHAGTAIVRFEGICFAAPGDRIHLAASDHPGWEPDDGCVRVEVVDSDTNHDCFSHTRAFRVESPGSHTFYGVCQNTEEMEGNGMASVFANLSVEFYADEPAALGDDGRQTAAFALRPNYPNPFNPVTTIAFELEEEGSAALCVYDLAGRLVRTLTGGVHEPGPWTGQWDGRDERGEPVPSGIYLYRLTAGDRTETRKMTLVR